MHLFTTNAPPGWVVAILDIILLREALIIGKFPLVGHSHQVDRNLRLSPGQAGFLHQGPLLLFMQSRRIATVERVERQPSWHSLVRETDERYTYLL